MPLPKPEFAELVKSIAAGRSMRMVADEVGISHTAVSAMLKGRVPRAETLRQFCDRLAVYPEARARLFEVAGYPDPAEPHSYQRALPPSLGREDVAAAVGEALTRTGISQRLQELARHYQTESGAERLVRGLLDLQARYGGPIPLDLTGSGSALTVDQAEKILATLELALRGQHAKGPAE